MDKYVDIPALHTLYKDLEDCMPASGFSIFHEEPKDMNDCEIALDENFLVSERKH